MGGAGGSEEFDLTGARVARVNGSPVQVDYDNGEELEWLDRDVEVASGT